MGKSRESEMMSSIKAFQSPKGCRADSLLKHLGHPLYHSKDLLQDFGIG